MTDGSPAAYRNDLLAAVIYADSDNDFNTSTLALSDGSGGEKGDRSD